MARKIVRVVRARAPKSDAEKLLDVRRTVNEYVATVAVAPAAKRRRASKKNSITIVTK